MYKKGDLVIIHPLHKGGEVTSVLPEGKYKVKIADFNPFNNKVEITTATFSETELETLPKRKGTIII